MTTKQINAAALATVRDIMPEAKVRSFIPGVISITAPKVDSWDMYQIRECIPSVRTGSVMVDQGQVVLTIMFDV